MCCEKIVELLPLYAEKMLNEEEMNLVCEHLKICEDCQAELKFLMALTQGFASLPEVEVRAEFAENLKEKIISQQKEALVLKTRRKWLKTYVAMAASAAIIALSVISLNSGVYKLEGNNDVSGAKTQSVQEPKAYEKATEEALQKNDEEKDEIKPIEKEPLATEKSKNDVLENEAEQPEKQVYEKNEKPLVFSHNENSADTAAKDNQNAFLTPPTENTEKAEINESTEQAENKDGVALAEAENEDLSKEASNAGASMARGFALDRVCERVSFYPGEMNDEAQEILNGFAEENGVYKIALDVFYEVTAELMMACGGEYKTEDLSDKYNELLEKGDEASDELLALDKSCEFGYIIIK